mgnify:CR=1 FL=1
MKPMTMINGLANKLEEGDEVSFTSFGRTGGLQANLNDDGMVTSLDEWSGGSQSHSIFPVPQTTVQTALEIIVSMAAGTLEFDDAEKYEPHRQEVHRFMETDKAKEIWPTYVRSNYFNEEE